MDTADESAPAPKPAPAAPRLPRRDQVLISLDVETRHLLGLFMEQMADPASVYYGKVNFTAACNKLIRERLQQILPKATP